MFRSNIFPSDRGKMVARVTLKHLCDAEMLLDSRAVLFLVRILFLSFVRDEETNSAAGDCKQRFTRNNIKMN